MQGHYPFIDIVALGKIRCGFAKAHALAIFSTDLSTLIWINGAGAELLGVQDIYNPADVESLLSRNAQKQIESQINDLQAGETAVLSLRLKSQLQQFQLSHLVLPDGVKAVLLESTEPVILANDTEHPALHGLNSANSHAALLDENGQIIASTENFTKAGIAQSTLADLTIEVRDTQNHILKRRIRAKNRSVPGAIIQLEQEPEVHLIYIVAEEADLTEFAPELLAHTTADVTTAPVSNAIANVDTPRFAFDVEAPTTRFIWKVDSDQIFTELSDSFAKALGPKASDIIGRRFSDVANVFGLDPHQEIAQLLQSRATWSGRRVMWPAEGTSLHVPVELAALPAFTREREFAGFNGFGVIHIADALPDPEKIGLCLSGDLPARDVAQTQIETTAEIGSPANVAAEIQSILPKRSEELIVQLAKQQVEQTAKQVKTSQESAKKEQKTDEPAIRSESGLSDTERSAFREIAERLRRQGIASQRDDSPFAPTIETAEHAPQSQAPQTPIEQIQAALHAPEQPSFVFRDENAPRIERPLLNLPEFNKKQTPSDTATKAAVKPITTAPSEPAPVPELNKKPVADNQDTISQSSAHEINLLSHVPFPVILHTGGDLVYANPAFLELTGYGSISDINSHGGVDALFNTERDDTSNDNSMVLRHQNSSEHAVDVYLQSVPWNNKKALMLSIMPKPAPSNDASEPSIKQQDDQDEDEFKKHEQTRQRLQTQVEELTSILDTATDGVVLIDNEGYIRSLNHSAAALFGYEETEIRGKSFSMLFAIESQRSAMDYLNSLSDNGVMSVLNDGREVIGREAQGGFIPMFMTLGKLPRSNSFCAVLRDITQWKRAEEELTSARREAERASGQKTEFLARISHEIRTPLNAIIGFSELMADERFGPIGNQRYRDYLRDINRSGNHVLTLVNDLLDISKIEAGAQEMNFEAVSLNDAISEAVALMQPQANSERVIIRSSFASNLPEIVADTRSIKQIALNLLSNAVRFTQAGGQVIVSTSYEMNGDVIMRVRDTGVGMDKSEIEQALKPFRQVNNRLHRASDTSKDWRNDGTGLGLPLTKAMVEANRAQLMINSNPGQGTVVEIIFPPTRVLAD